MYFVIYITIEMGFLNINIGKLLYLTYFSVSKAKIFHKSNENYFMATF